MSMQTLTWDVDAAAVVAGNSDAYILSRICYAGETKNQIFAACNVSLVVEVKYHLLQHNI